MPDGSNDELLRRAERAAAGMRISEAFQSVRAIVGPSTFPEGEELAEEAMALLRQGKIPTPRQRAALEMVIRALRPAVLTRDGELLDLPSYQRYSQDFRAAWHGFQEAVKPYLYSIGRIDRVGGTANEPLATGFLVAPHLLVTNKHVFESLSGGAQDLERGQAVLRVGQEWSVPDRHPPIPITGLRALHPTLDIAVLEVEPTDLRPLAVDPVGVPDSARVVAVGYPQDDPRSPVFRDVVFENKWKVKRAAPGEVVGTEPCTIYHDCSTLGGNSGSPLLAIETAHVVGLHRDGPLFLWRNEAVDGAALDSFLRPLVP